MCHQTVGLVAAEIEKRGIPTTSVSALPEVTAKVRVPRALAVPFALGYTLGRPDDAALQTGVLRAAFALLESRGPAPVLVDWEPSA